MATPSQEFPVQFGRYRLLRKLAKGGMAELFLAERPGSAQQLVIKRVLPHFCSDPEFLTMFLNEARIAAQLNHPNIVGVYDLGQQGEHIYIAMEFIDGSDLEHLAKECGGTIPPHLAARIGACICEALYYANRSPDVSTGKPLNVIHRDVTPGNVMITRTGQVKLVDFGVAKATAQLERTRPGVVKGKFRYMSPEQIQLKELDGRSDLFSLGVLLYEITTGKKPFDRTQVIDIIRALSGWDPPPPADFMPGYPRPLSNVIMGALRKDPDQRFRDGREMGRALELALQQMSAAGPTELGQFVSRYLAPAPEEDSGLPPWEEPAGAKPDSSTRGSGRNTPASDPPPWAEHAGGKTDPSAPYPSPPASRLGDSHGSEHLTRSELRRARPAPVQPAAPARVSPPPSRSPLAPPVRTPAPPSRPTRADGPAPLPPPVFEPATPFDDEEKTTLAPGPFSGLNEQPKPKATARAPVRRTSLPAVSLEDALGADDGPQTITNQERPPKFPQPRRTRRLVLFATFFALLCAAAIAGGLLLKAPVPVPEWTEIEQEGGTEAAAVDLEGTLSVQGPTNAKVFIDGAFNCTAPCSAKLSPGEHTVTRQGHKKPQTVEIVAGETVSLTL